jgi:hypothetical protein
LGAKTKIVLAAVAALIGIVIIIQDGTAYAISTEKVSLVQQYEQFDGQKVTGFCNVELDDEGNLHWLIKVKGLVPETQGQFDLGHWAGDIDVAFIADKEGNANSNNQIILAADVPHPIFTQFAACHVYAIGNSHNDFPGIATGKLKII